MDVPAANAVAQAKYRQAIVTGITLAKEFIVFSSRLNQFWGIAADKKTLNLTRIPTMPMTSVIVNAMDSIMFVAFWLLQHLILWAKSEGGAAR